MNLARVLDGHDAQRVALVDGDRTLTYGDLRRAVAAWRARLAELGVGVGDVVAIAAGNEVHFASGVLAALAEGAIVMPLNPSGTFGELEQKLAAGRPKVLLVGQVGRAQLDHRERIDATVVDMDEAEDDGRDGDLDPAATEPTVERTADDPAFYMATSGVSGSPKVAVLSHGNLDWVQEALADSAEPLTQDDVTLGLLPFVHIFGLNVVLFASLRAGSAIVLQRRFDTDESLRLIREHGVTLLTGAPPMWQRWAQADAPDDTFATVRYAASGAAALPIGTFETVRDRFGIEIAQGYGLTETSPVVTHGRGHPVRPSSVGKVMDGVTVALVDVAGEPVDIGDEGEVVVHSPGVFLGYLDDQETTDSVLTDDGWLWTGDVGIFDEEGYLYLVDRIKDVVIVSGFNVYPAEVEDVLMQHPDVSGAIVTGSPDDQTGERVVAHVTGTVDEAELTGFVAERLSRYKRPTVYHFLDELPITPTGKAHRRELR